MTRYPEFGDLLGETIAAVNVVGDDRVEFKLADGRTAILYHSQDCCESVVLAEVVGDWADVIGAPLLIAEVVANSEIDPPEYPDSWTWSFYKLATVKGHLTMRWLGESNGYYSEEVAFNLPEKVAA
jgi:hypothetical protein